MCAMFRLTVDKIFKETKALSATLLCNSYITFCNFNTNYLKKTFGMKEPQGDSQSIFKGLDDLSLVILVSCLGGGGERKLNWENRFSVAFAINRQDFGFCYQPTRKLDTQKGRAYRLQCFKQKIYQLTH